VAFTVSRSTLAHPTRQRIYFHIVQLPGDHFRSIVRSLHLALGTASHHLEILVREGLVLRDRASGRCRYYPKGHESQAERNRLFMRHWNFRDLRVRILFAVANSPRARPVDIGRKLRVSRQLASYHLNQLVGMGLVTREDGRYVASPSWTDHVFAAQRAQPA